MQEIQVEVKFVKAFLNKANRTSLLLSDGLETKFFSTDMPVSDFSEYEKGDVITVTLNVDVFDEYATKVTSVQS